MSAPSQARLLVPRHMPTVAAAVLCMAACLNLAGCGGGGASSPAPAPTPAAAPEDRLATAQGVDLARGLRITRNNRERYLHLLEGALDGLQQHLLTLRERLAAGDFAGAKPIAHTVKGTAGNVGLTTVAAVAIELDEVLRGPDPNANRCSQLMDALDAALAEVAHALHD